MYKVHNRKLHLLAVRVGDIQKKTTLRGVAGWDGFHHAIGAKTQGVSYLWAGALLLVNQLLQQAADELCIAMSKLQSMWAESCETYLLDL